ncbi:hypothetical protein M885DRAFT_278609 [Pelagophyceae sp. CCMP2097]|nr:hypothetical protein M885DRAFT_278609 [Pelagophyceae sp. CCMP2097]
MARWWCSAALVAFSGVAPLLRADDARVRVRAIGLNFADVFSVLGLYAAATEAGAGRGPDDPFACGLEFAGVVEDAGPDSGFRPGDRVFGFTRFGAFADHVVQRGALLRPSPAGWTDAEAASILVQGMTAWYALVTLGGARAGSRVLVHSAAGGVGLLALEICRTRGCRALAVVSSAAKAALIRDRFGGAVETVVRGRAPTRDYAEALDAFGAFDVVLESLGGRWLAEALRRVAPMGRLVTFGATASYGGAADGWRKWPALAWTYLWRPLVDPGELTATNRGVLGFNLIWLTEDEAMLADCLDAMLRGGVADRAPLVGKSFDFARLPDALRHLQSGTSTGKIVVLVGDDDRCKDAAAS